MKIIAAVTAVLFLVALHHDEAHALRLSSASSSASEKKRPRQKKRPPRHLFRKSLKSIARVARDGSSTWGDHVASSGLASNNRRVKQHYQSTSMKQSSTTFISKLHKKIQTQQERHPKETLIRNKKQHYASAEEMIEEYNYEYPEEHFVQEILAVAVSGVAATSAFAAVATGAFIATLAAAVGSVVIVLFLDDTIEVDATFTETIDDEASDYHEEIREDDCDITSDTVIDSNKITQQNEEPTFRPIKKFTNFTMDELRRCYEGRLPMPLYFSNHLDDMCIIYTEEGETSTTSLKDDTEPSDNSGLVGDGVVKALHDACSAGECDKMVPSVDPPEFNKRVNVVWHDPRLADDSNYRRDIALRRRKEHSKRSRGVTRSGISNHRQVNEYVENLTDAEKEGALLLSQSFRVAASAFGLVADAVRFTGETAAVCTGGTARMAGGIFKLSGWAVNSLGSAIEHGSMKRDSIPQVEQSHSAKQRTSKRKVAGESVRLLGESIEQVADSLLLAGSATERVTFAAASIAESAVRFFGDISLSASEMFAKESQNALDLALTSKQRGHTTNSADKESGINTDQLETDATTLAINETTKLDGSLIESQVNDESYFFFWATNNLDEIMADTIGVGSLAPELLGVFVACYLGSLLLLRQNRKKCKVEEPISKSFHISVPEEHVDAPHKSFTHDTHIDTDSHTTLTADWTTKPEMHRSRSHFLKQIIRSIFFVILSPMKLFVLTASGVWSLVFNRKSILLLFYTMGFLFLSRSSQYKAAVIKRKSELLGYHNALASISQSSMSYIESSMWLNAILNNVWRVNDDMASISFGGLEPYLSSLASASLVESLSGSYKKPNGIAHVSFNSFTFGETPPMIRGISVASVDSQQSIVYMTIDIGVLMEAELLLDISPSSLEYKMVPTTTLSINSLDAELKLDVSVTSIPSYPYVSNVNVSLSQAIPDFSLRIEPRSQSGKGVDFGSFPLISKWIKESISESLSDYVAPKYISINFPAWLNGDPTFVSYISNMP